MSKDTGKCSMELQSAPLPCDEDGLRVDRWFRRHYPGLSHGMLQKWLRKGQIRVNGKRVEASDRLKTDDLIRIPPPLLKEESYSCAPAVAAGGKKPLRNTEKIKGWILFEDKDVVVLNKPAGLAVQGGTGITENLDDSLMTLSLDGETRPKLVHRLDRETSGVLVIARNDFSAARLAASFRSRRTKKIYWALTKGVPTPYEGLIDASIIKHGQTMHIATKDDGPEAKRALTHYAVIEALPRQLAFVALWPVTGRTHQLRVHMAHAGAPIFGDPLYKSLKPEDNPHTAQTYDFSALDFGEGLHLHARQIIIPHPRGGVIDVTAPLGPSMKKTWQCLNLSEKNVAAFEDA